MVRPPALDRHNREGDGYCFRDVDWVQRRPRVYGAFVDESSWGNMPLLQTTGE